MAIRTEYFERGRTRRMDGPYRTPGEIKISKKKRDWRFKEGSYLACLAIVLCYIAFPIFGYIFFRRAKQKVRNYILAVATLITVVYIIAHALWIPFLMGLIATFVVLSYLLVTIIGIIESHDNNDPIRFPFIKYKE